MNILGGICIRYNVLNKCVLENWDAGNISLTVVQRS